MKPYSKRSLKLANSSSSDAHRIGKFSLPNQWPELPKGNVTIEHITVDESDGKRTIRYTSFTSKTRHLIILCLVLSLVIAWSSHDSSIVHHVLQVISEALHPLRAGPCGH